jgi:4-hydroxy-L-threonine phosphate dehydrogenase PdxA
MISKKRITVGITMGDPSGIGPEIILKSFENSIIRNSRIIVIGDYNVMQAAHDLLKIKSFILNRIHYVSDCLFNTEVLNILDLHLGQHCF